MFKFVLYGNKFLISLNNLLFKNIPRVGSFWHFVRYLCICNYVFVCLAHRNIIFDIFSKIYHMLGPSGTSSYDVFVYLYFCICAFGTWKYNFWYPWTILFSKIYQMLGLSGTSSYAVFVYLCILYLYFCICAFCAWEYNFCFTVRWSRSQAGQGYPGRPSNI